MKNSCWIIGLFVFTSCKFHLIENPGPQVSWSPDQAKNNKTFICSYRSNKIIINGKHVNCIFAEKKYTSDAKLFSDYKVDSTASQLVLVFNDLLSKDGYRFGVNWTISACNDYSDKITYRNYNTQSLPDSIVMNVYNFKDNDTAKIIQKFMLYKIRKALNPH